MVFYVDLIFCTTWQLYIIMVTSLQVEHMNPPKFCLLCIRRLFGLPQMINIKEDEVEKKNKMGAARLDLSWFGLHCKYQLKDVAISHQNITLT